MRCNQRVARRCAFAGRLYSRSSSSRLAIRSRKRRTVSVGVYIFSPRRVASMRNHAARGTMPCDGASPSSSAPNSRPDPHRSCTLRSGARLSPPRHFRHRCIDRTGVNEVIIVLVTAVALQFARDKQPLFRTRRSAQFRRHPTRHRLDNQRPLFAIADFESLTRRGR